MRATVAVLGPYHYLGFEAAAMKVDCHLLFPKKPKTKQLPPTPPPQKNPNPRKLSFLHRIMFFSRKLRP